MSDEDTYICDMESLIEHKPLLKPEIIKDFIFLDNFNILCLNARSLRDKFASFRILLKTLNISFSLIVITESWFLEYEFLNQYELDGYNIFVIPGQKIEVEAFVCTSVRSLRLELSRHGCRGRSHWRWRCGTMVPVCSVHFVSIGRPQVSCLLSSEALTQSWSPCHRVRLFWEI